MKKVYIISPLGGKVNENLEKVKNYTRYALFKGVAPIVSHFYAECLDDKKERERSIAMAAGLALLWFCDEAWCFGSKITKGMESELNFCKNLNINVTFIKDDEVKKFLGGKKL